MDINMASSLSEMVAMLYYASWFHPDHSGEIDPMSVHSELLKKYSGMEIGTSARSIPRLPSRSPELCQARVGPLFLGLGSGAAAGLRSSISLFIIKQIGEDSY